MDHVQISLLTEVGMGAQVVLGDGTYSVEFLAPE